MKTLTPFLLPFFFITLNCYSQMKCGFKAHDVHDGTKNFYSIFQDIKEQELDISNDRREIPLKVIEDLNCFLDNFDIANSDEEYQSDCSSEEGKPTKHLTFMAKNDKYLVLSYSAYSLGVTGTNILMKYDEEGIVYAWFGGSMGGIPTAKKVDLNMYLQIVESSMLNEQEMFNAVKNK